MLLLWPFFELLRSQRGSRYPKTRRKLLRGQKHAQISFTVTQGANWLEHPVVDHKSMKGHIHQFCWRQVTKVFHVIWPQLFSLTAICFNFLVGCLSVQSYILGNKLYSQLFNILFRFWRNNIVFLLLNVFIKFCSSSALFSIYVITSSVPFSRDSKGISKLPLIQLIFQG